MDRFIAKQDQDRQKQKVTLKSNMDRFIDTPLIIQNISVTAFKIQYG